MKITLCVEKHLLNLECAVMDLLWFARLYCQLVTKQPWNFGETHILDDWYVILNRCTFIYPFIVRGLYVLYVPTRTCAHSSTLIKWDLDSMLTTQCKWRKQKKVWKHISTKNSKCSVPWLTWLPHSKNFPGLNLLIMHISCILRNKLK